MSFLKKVLLTSLLLVFGMLTACQQASRPQPESGLRIVTSFYPIYAMTKEVSGDVNDVRMIQSGAGIHDFEPSVADVAAIYDADLFIYHSHTLESWAGQLAPNLTAEGVEVFEASQSMTLDKVAGLEDMTVAEGMDEASLYDPHTWLDPSLVAEEVILIAEELARLDPANADYYQANAQQLVAKTKDLITHFEPIFDKSSQKTFVTQHTAFSYLAKRFGLKQLGIANVSDQEPSPRQLAEIKAFIADYKVKRIFVERGMSDKMAQTLAKSTGISIDILDPLEADPDNNLSYLENLEMNLESLAQALQAD